MRGFAAYRFVLVVVSWAYLGCASDLIVRAPDTVRAPRPSPLADLAPLAISIDSVEPGPDPRAPIGERGAAFLQPGGPIYLTEAPTLALRRTIEEMLSSAGHRVVSRDAQVHVELGLLEFKVDAPRDGGAWDVVARVAVSLRVSATPGDAVWDEIRSKSERSQTVVWRPETRTVDGVRAGGLEGLAQTLASSDELASALATHAR